MRIVMIYKQASDHASRVETYLSDFSRQTGHDIEHLDPESLEGESFCRAYDILEYPTMVAIDSSGRVLNEWRTNLPTISEASFYVQDN